MKALVDHIHNVQEFRLKDTRYVSGIIDVISFQRLLNSRRIERMTIDYGNNENLYLVQNVDRWSFEQESVSFIHMTPLELFDFICREIPMIIYLYCKPYRDLPDEKDRVIQISFEDNMMWRITMTQTAYHAQGYHRK